MVCVGYDCPLGFPLGQFVEIHLRHLVERPTEAVGKVSDKPKNIACV